MALALRPTGWWRQLSHSIDSYNHACIGHQASPTSTGTIGTANRATYMPVMVTERVVVTSLWFGCSTVSSGSTVYLGLYDANGVQLASASAAHGGAATEQVMDITDLTIGPGIYYLALSCTSGTATFRSELCSNGLGASRGFLVEDSAAPLPSTATWVTDSAMNYAPLIGMLLNTVVT